MPSKRDPDDWPMMGIPPRWHVQPGKLILLPMTLHSPVLVRVCHACSLGPQCVFGSGLQSPPASFKLPPAQIAQTIPPIFASFDSVRVGHGHSKGVRRRKFHVPHALGMKEISISFLHCLTQCPWHAARKAHSGCA
jgi:hypothetical protein